MVWGWGKSVLRFRKNTFHYIIHLFFEFYIFFHKFVLFWNERFFRFFWRRSFSFGFNLSIYQLNFFISLF